MSNCPPPHGLQRNLRRDESGATIAEFALILPALAMTLLALFDFSYNYYAETMIEGAVQKAARDSTIEIHAGNYDALDERVTRAVQRIVYDADMQFTRTAYANFSDVGRPEDYTDLNTDGLCNNGEPFEDANHNRQWDEDRGSDSTGGARDAVMYEVVASYDRPFPIPGLVGLDPEVKVVARTILRNQPFGLSDEPGVGNCP
ncbi:pilus assembly protein [Erythrobacter arachoides]|uniref:Pilus assembly protein n=1 Tax=Aurantiacibacter arachoides TaxID=1850444 RepID=A0A845A0W6_9SPHN|nr:TadE/TadG family type IV pilus assembly protein [Aurantiacibacter arachoides]MXO93122.1 pilus assembly protein [Aurantiacibacter arachoides]GGD51868.1 hypothetical protein GCM10011411_09630 [Aurantiacibacter arachoides]